MVVTLGHWVNKYNVREKPTVILCIYINRHAGTPDKNSENKNIVVHTSNMVVIIYCYIGFEDEVTTWYYSKQLIEVVNTYDLA